MEFMSVQQRRIMARLVELAGNPLLVEEAFRELSKRPDPPTILDVVTYIVEHRVEWHQRMDRSRAESQREVAPV